jgi:hypothetical protein
MRCILEHRAKSTHKYHHKTSDCTPRHSYFEEERINRRNTIAKLISSTLALLKSKWLTHLHIDTYGDSPISNRGVLDSKTHTTWMVY